MFIGNVYDVEMFRKTFTLILSYENILDRMTKHFI